MATSPPRQGRPSQTTPAQDSQSPQPEQRADRRQLSRWGGVAAIAGVVLMLGSVAVVVGLGLPDASDPETLTDFADIESGRIAEHILYLGALILFALHVFVLQRLLRPAHPAAALFGAVVAAFGLVTLAASSVLHVSTAPLAELYTSADADAEDQQMIEYAWHGAQSVFDTMLTTGALLVPIGMLFFGIAMRNAHEFGPRLGALVIGLGTLGIIGALIEVIDTTSDFVAISVLAIVIFNLIVGWRTLRLGTVETSDPRRSDLGAAT